MIEAALDKNRDGLFVLVRGDNTLQDTFRHGGSLLLCGFSSFLVQHRLHAGCVTTDGAHTGGVLQLVGRLLEAQVERFLLESDEALTQFCLLYTSRCV